MLHLQNVSVTFPPDVRALDNVNLQFRQGQFTVLLGQSGAGKSTLLRCLNLLQSPTQGLVVGDDDQCLSGLNKHAPRLRQHRRHTAMVFQMQREVRELAQQSARIRTLPHAQLGSHTIQAEISQQRGQRVPMRDDTE